MTKLAYNNTKNASIGYISFEFNCRYHRHIFFKKKTNSCYWSRFAHKLAQKLKDLMLVCH